MEMPVSYARACRYSLWCIAVAALITSMPIPAALPENVRTIAPMLEQVVPGVVNISTRSRVLVRDNPFWNDPFFRRFFEDVPGRMREREAQSLGSGVIIDVDRGYILTNHHVVGKADSITVTLYDGHNYEAELIGSDPDTDVALIRIDAESLSELPYANINDLRVGDFVVAIGNPFGLGQTVTSGIVSALGRNSLGIHGYEDYIQTDAPINPGNSGGALVNFDGELIGINTAIIGPTGGNIGIGFAIPVDMALKVMRQLVAFGEVRRGELGVVLQDLNEDLQEALDLSTNRGAVVTQVVDDSPADAAGLEPGDVIVQVDGKAANSAAAVRNAIGLTPAGDTVRLVILREGEHRTLAAKIVAPEPVTLSGSELAGRFQGASFGPIKEGHPLFGRTKGVMVYTVDRNSSAARLGLRPDDVILAVNRQPVATVDEFETAVAGGDRTLLLNIQRGSQSVVVMSR